VVVLAVGLLVAGVLGARALTRTTASDLIPLESAGPSLPAVTGPTVHTTGWSTSGNPTTRLAWSAVTIANQGTEPVTITRLDTDGATHDFRAVLSRLLPEDVDGLVIDDTIPRELDKPGLASLEVPAGREALVVLGFTAGCDATDTGFAPSVTLALTSPAAGEGRFTLDATDSSWVLRATDFACTPAPPPSAG
jgi:hypothetical protein